LLVKHQLSEMLAQRIYGLALGYEDLNDHEQLRRDPLLAVLAGKRNLDETLVGKSTLNRLELTGKIARYHKIAYSAEALDRLLADIYIESHGNAPDQIVLDLDATDIPLYGHQPERFFFHGYYDSYCFLHPSKQRPLARDPGICRCISSPATSYCACGCGQPTRMRLPARWKKSAASWRSCAGAGPR